jgi:hypothetical protein
MGAGRHRFLYRPRFAQMDKQRRSRGFSTFAFGCFGAADVSCWLAAGCEVANAREVFFAAQVASVRA